MRFASGLMALSVLALPNTVVAQGGDQVISSRLVSGWTLDEYASRCSMTAKYGDRELLLLRYDAKLESVMMLFSDPSVHALANGEKRTIRVDLINTARNHLDDGWGSTDFLVVKPDNEPTAFVAKFNSEILGDIATNNTIAFSYKNTVLQSFSLDGSAAAVAALRTCALKRRISIR